MWSIYAATKKLNNLHFWAMRQISAAACLPRTGRDLRPVRSTVFAHPNQLDFKPETQRTGVALQCRD
jgi:hypothetical protein